METQIPRIISHQSDCQNAKDCLCSSKENMVQQSLEHATLYLCRNNQWNNNCLSLSFYSCTIKTLQKGNSMMSSSLENPSFSLQNFSPFLKSHFYFISDSSVMSLLNLLLLCYPHKTLPLN